MSCRFLRIGQSLVLCRSGVQDIGFSWRRLLEMFLYSALVGSTVDTSSRQYRCFFAFQRNAWIDSGYYVASVYGVFVFRAMLGSTVETNLRTSTELFCITTQCLV